MLEAKERTEKQLEEERERRIAEGGIIWPVWSWITSGSQPADTTSGRSFSVVSDKIKVVEDPLNIGDGTTSDTDDEGTINTNLIKSAFAQKIHFRLKNEPKTEIQKETTLNSETNALSELTEEVTEGGQITEEEAEITDDISQGAAETEARSPTVDEAPSEEAAKSNNENPEAIAAPVTDPTPAEATEVPPSENQGETDETSQPPQVEFVEKETAASIEILSEITDKSE